MSRPVCHMLVGVPGSGKSTWARSQDLPVVSSDAWVERLAAERGQTYNQAFAEVVDEAMSRFSQDIDQLVRHQQSFVWDQTNLGQGARAKKLRRLRGYDIVAQVWQIPESELERRRTQRTDKVIPPGVLRDMLSQFAVPSLDEGFCKINMHYE